MPNIKFSALAPGVVQSNSVFPFVADPGVSAAATTATPAALKTGLALVKADVGLGSVTNDIQTRSAIVPNTAPSAGQILVGNAGGTAYAPVALSGAGTLTSAGVLSLSASFTNLWQRVSTTLSPVTANDSVSIGSGTFTGAAAVVASITSPAALTVTPAAGSNLNVVLSTTGDFAVNTNQLYVDTSTAQVGIGTSTFGANAAMQLTRATDSRFYLDAPSGQTKALGFTESGSLKCMFYLGSSDELRLYDGIVGDMVKIPMGSGNIGIGTSPNSNAILDVASTTKAFMPPRMTTVQKNAVASPTAGMVVYDSTLSKLSVYTGAAWQTVTSV